MRLQSIATALNLRASPGGKVIGELRMGDVAETPKKFFAKEWAEVAVTTGVSAGLKGFVRRKWLAQHFDAPPRLSGEDRTAAARIVAQRTHEFDAIAYGLGDKAKSWTALRGARRIDCSGWVYLMIGEILAAYGKKTPPGAFLSHSDDQVTRCGAGAECLITAPYLQHTHFQPGVIVGLDYSEYSWDRGRALDVDHVGIVGGDAGDLFFSQSSSSGGGVNRVPLAKWLKSHDALARAGRMHVADLLALP
ncbi:hypothetical protein [Ramlibacter sp.]|uniref:hypothetical protein n=1 Tax=Ramlibacter sp. TaxID=1917967 RepID=UPI003D0C1322